MAHFRRLAASIVLTFAVFTSLPTAGTNLPSGFAETIVASGLASPTAMEIAPDGRVFVAEQAGRLRVIKNGALLPTPFLTLTVDSAGERGLLGVTFDPNFATNKFVYVYYTVRAPNLHNRVSRFTANGDVAVAGSEVVILDLDPLSGATNHNGGAIHFGEDGKLYVAVGDNAFAAHAQSLANRLGKILRINADGSIPADNPFYGQAAGANRSIWALGLRNPYTFAIESITARMFINDVGQNTWEEINEGVAGSNYGWHITEGPTSNPSFRSPVYAYQHGAGVPTGCAITGGAFYNPLTTFQFPVSYDGDYFFADYCGGWIYRLETSNFTATQFATGISAPVDLKVSDNGPLYYLARGSGAATGIVGMITYANAPPTITAHPSNLAVAVGQSATFSVTASGSSPLTYQWQRNGANIAGATSPSYTIASAQVSDTGARFRVVVTNSFGTVTSNEATLAVTSNSAPIGAITQPSTGSLYSGGQTISFAGTGTDAEDGSLPASAFTWEVVFHHATHTHPFMQPTSGIKSGSFVIPTMGETASNVWYRIHLTVRDSVGLTHTTFRDVQPRTAQVTVTTTPTGLEVRVDGQPSISPATFTGVVGIQRTLMVMTPQTLGGTAYAFQSWSDGGSVQHTISTPASNTTYTATFAPTTASTTVWVDDATPAGAVLASVGGDTWNWVTSNPAPMSGVRAHQSALVAGLHQHYFYNATGTLSVGVADTLFAYVYLDPANPPSQVMLQWYDGTWEHRAYWGSNLIAWGIDGTASRRSMGALPAAGQWVKLSVPASQVGLEGRTLRGMAFTLYDGRATWDYAGKTTAGPVWVDDATPAGASLGSAGGDTWNWVTSNPAPFSGTRAHQSALAAGMHQHYFNNATGTLSVGAGDTLFAYVYLDPANPPSQVMLQWYDGTWEHRAYWGSNSIAWGIDGTVSRRSMGALPAAGQWVKLSVPAWQVGLEGRTVRGMAFTLYGGRATWDYAGKTP